MVHHVLNGEALHSKFPSSVRGELVVCNECLVEGPCDADHLEDFFRQRASYLEATYRSPARDYEENVAAEFRKLRSLENNDVVVLWFEHDLFCQANMWFVVYLVQQLPVNVHIERVFPIVPEPARFWSGFGPSSAEQLREAYSKRRRLTYEEIQLCADLWVAYKTNDLARMQALADKDYPAVPLLKKVVQAHTDRFSADNAPSKLEKYLMSLYQEFHGSFPDIFKTFCQQEGIYGFGDLQVKRMIEQLKT